MENPFENLYTELKSLRQEVAQLTQLLKGTGEPARITMNEFCQQYQVSRPTVYAWAERGLIRLEQIGKRNFIPLSSITVSKKFQRVD